MGDETEEAVENILSHHGIKGMKWGIRRDRRALETARGKLPSKVHEDFATSQKIRAKKAPYLSNEEIKKANERANLESQFHRNNPGKLERGHSHVKQILGFTATAGTAYTFLNSELGQKLIGKGAKTMTSPVMAKAGKKIVIKAGESFI